MLPLNSMELIIFFNFSFVQTDRSIVSVENIIAVQSDLNSTTMTELTVSESNADDTNDEKQSNIKQFTIVYAKRMENSSNPNKWRHFSQIFQNDDSQVCQLWIRAIQHQIDGKNFIFFKVSFRTIP